jgi:hypothetical protein
MQDLIPAYKRSELEQTQTGREAIKVIELLSEEVNRLTDIVERAQPILREINSSLKEELKYKALPWFLRAW